MKPATLFAILSILAFGCANTGQSGIEESQKTQIAETMSDWAGYFNQQNWDSISSLYAQEVDFNGRPLSKAAVAGTMAKFMEKDGAFSLKFDPETWALDSMRGKIFAGHMVGTAQYQSSAEFSADTRIGFWVRLNGLEDPQIVAQFDEIGAAYKTVKDRHHDAALAGQDYDSLGYPNYTFWNELTNGLQSKVGQLRFFGKHRDRYIFYALDKRDVGKMGIVDQDGMQVVPYAYDDIGSIGLFLPDAMEVRIGTKKGLLRFEGTEILPTEFDAILPIFNDPRRALWAYRDGQWACYDSDGKPVIPEGGNAYGSGPDWVTYLQELPLENLWKPNHPDCITSRLGSYYLSETESFLGDYGVVRVPFTLAERHVLQDMTGGSMEMGSSVSMTIDSVFLTSDGRVQMLSTIEDWGIGGRESYHDLHTSWVVFEPELRDTMQQVHLYTKSIDDYVACKGGEMRVINDTLIESFENAYLINYWQAPRFRYFRIKADGGINPLLPEREFPFMSLVTVDKEFLQGCFSGSASEAESQAYKAQNGKGEDDYGDVSRTAKFWRAADLDYLVNEVYAAHGMEFTKEQWKAYFKEKSWYKPVSGNVEAALSTLEKKNIAFVRSLQKEMKGKESAFMQESFSWQEGI